MDYIQVYQGSAPTVNVNLTNPDGTPYNASGAVLYLSAAQDYASPPFFTAVTTGLGANLSGALTGLMVFNLTTGDTTRCAGDYPGGLLLVDIAGKPNPMPVGYTVLPVILPV